MCAHGAIVRIAAIGTLTRMARFSMLRRAFTAMIGVLVGVLAMPSAAHAHTDFDYSLPTDGASVGVPLTEVTVAFTSPVTLVGNGFEVLDPQNNVLQPFAVTDDDTVFRLQFDPPLAGGTVAVKYEVRAEDGHVLSGNFVFVVDAAPPTTLPPTTLPPATVPPDAAEPDADAPEATTTTAPAAVTTTVPPPDTTQTAPTGDEEAAEVDARAGGVPGSGGGNSSGGVIIVIAAAVALGAGGFLLVRSRTSGAT